MLVCVRVSTCVYVYSWVCIGLIMCAWEENAQVCGCLYVCVCLCMHAYLRVGRYLFVCQVSMCLCASREKKGKYIDTCV